MRGRVCIGLVLLALSARAADLAFPSTSVAAPDCALTATGDGTSLHIGQFRGKVVYLDFWASWCPPCAKSFPFLNTLNRELRERGLQIVGVNLDENPADAQKFMTRFPPEFTVATSPGAQCARDYSVQGMPSSYLIDRNGLVRYARVGFRPGEAQALRALVETLLAEAPASE